MAGDGLAAATGRGLHEIVQRIRSHHDFADIIDLEPPDTEDGKLGPCQARHPLMHIP